MHTIPPTQEIDLNREVKAIFDFTIKHWVIKDLPLFEKFVQDVFDYGRNLAKNNFNEHAFSTALRNLVDPDKNHNYLSKKEKFNISDLMFETNTVSNIMKDSYNYGDFMPLLLKSMKSNFSTLKTVKPKNWTKFKNNPELYDYHDYPLDAQDGNAQEIDNFDGTSPILQFSQSSYPRSISCGSVHYAYERDRNPFQTLIGAIITQAYCVEIHNNTAAMIHELSLMHQVSLTDKKMTLKNSAPLIYNQTLKVLFELSTSKEIEKIEKMNTETSNDILKSIQDMLKGIDKQTPEQKQLKSLKKEAQLKIVSPLFEHLYNTDSLMIKKRKM